MSKIFRVFATYEAAVYADVEAESSQEAYEKAQLMDGADFKEYELGLWQIEPDPVEITK